MKKYIFLAASVLTLASCSSDDFLGDTQGSTPTSANSTINFSGNAGKITRATSNEGKAEKMLDYQFKVYGVKKMSKNGVDKFEPSFTDYSVWYDEAKNTTSNTNGWEYVGNQKAGNEDVTYGSGNVKLQNDQYIKYWDYAAEEYHFVAGSPISAFTYNKNADIETAGMKIPSATITGLAGHIVANKEGTRLETNPVYVATPIIVPKSDYQKPVKFEFNRQQAMVRVGIYETIPGYSITEIKFYEADGTKATSNNVILTSATPEYFVGGKGIKGTVKYDWTTAKPSYTFEYGNEQLTKDKNWYAGLFEPNSPLATIPTETDATTLYGKDKDMSDKGYFTVLPTPSATTAAPIIIKCDYTLNTDDFSDETIKVTGATAAIPAAYSKWDVNTRYTYLFKISDKTNGTTGDPTNPDDPAGLYPITFNAVVTEMADKTEGTTTTFTAPSITTYQKGSVEGNTIKYVADKNIDVTVLNDKAEVQTLKTTNEEAEQVGHIAVYKFDTEITEAEVQVKGVTGATKIAGSVDANNVFTFKPTDAGWYAIKYLAKAKVGTTPAVYTYKVVKVEAAPATK